MDIGTKLEYIKQHIDNIVTHDDAPAEEVESALVDLANHLVERTHAFVERRFAIAAEREAQAVTAGDVGDAADVLGL